MVNCRLDCCIRVIQLHVHVFVFALTQDEQATTELARIAGEFADQGVQQAEITISNKGDDLLAMMDNMEP